MWRCNDTSDDEVRVKLRCLFCGAGAFLDDTTFDYIPVGGRPGRKPFPVGTLERPIS